jgi:LPXTG-motif cell wall-anchored protein
MNPKTRAMLLSAAAVLLIAGIAAKALPLVGGHATVPQANGLCASTLGTIGQAFSRTLASRCSQVTGIEQASGWAIAAGIVLLATTAALAWRRRATA